MIHNPCTGPLPNGVQKSFMSSNFPRFQTLISVRTFILSHVFFISTRTYGLKINSSAFVVSSGITVYYCIYYNNGLSRLCCLTGLITILVSSACNPSLLNSLNQSVTNIHPPKFFLDKTKIRFVFKFPSNGNWMITISD